MTLPVASFTDWTPRTFRIASGEMRLEPAAACLFAQRYKGGEYLLPRSLAMGIGRVFCWPPIRMYRFAGTFSIRTIMFHANTFPLESFCTVRARVEAA